MLNLQFANKSFKFDLHNAPHDSIVFKLRKLVNRAFYCAVVHNSADLNYSLHL